MNKLNKQALFFLLVGIVGACIILYGLMQPVAQLYYIVGSILLLLTALYSKLTYFIALELILIAGHGAILLGIGPILQVGLPILLSFQLFFYYLFSGRLQNIFRLIGIIGIAVLSIGFAYQNQWIFLIGSLSISIFSLNQYYEGRRIALLWAILNLIFAASSAYQLMF